MNSSDEFERQVHRIYELLLDSAAEVTWDDHIPDPDNLEQLRQIDVTIRRDGKLTLVECRKHQARQDVQWIEELIGRRTSLHADAVIAVSASGFTAGALKKAKQHGIIPRDLQQLTDAEVKSWGRQVALTLYFYQYSDLEVSLLFKHESILKLDAEVLKSEFRSHPAVQSLFNAAAKELGNLKLVTDQQPGRKVKFDLRLQLEAFRLCGESVVEVGFRGNVYLLSKAVVSPAVFVYSEAGNPQVREATLEVTSLGETSIIHDGSRISVLVDISQLEIPPFCQFRFFRVTGHDEMALEALELYGFEKLWVTGGKMNVTLCSAAGEHASEVESPDGLGAPVAGTKAH